MPVALIEGTFYVELRKKGDYDIRCVGVVISATRTKFVFGFCGTKQEKFALFFVLEAQNKRNLPCICFVFGFCGTKQEKFALFLL